MNPCHHLLGLRWCQEDPGGMCPTPGPGFSTTEASRVDNRQTDPMKEETGIQEESGFGTEIKLPAAA